jgi:hypothetical protein
MKLLIMQFYSACFRFKYSPQHCVLKYPHTMYFLWGERPTITPVQNNNQNYSFINFNLCF